MMRQISERKYKALQRAERLAREVRQQIAAAGGVYDNNKVAQLLFKWQRVAGKRFYKEPAR